MRGQYHSVIEESLVQVGKIKPALGKMAKRFVRPKRFPSGFV
jgi:hypothetical protein